MIALPRLRSLTLIAALALFALGCKQENGEVCDVESDCAEASFCCGGGELPARRGICQADGTTCDVVTPPEPEPDAGPVPDAGPQPDGGPEDAGPEDAGAEDAGTDAGTTEADAGTDAGAIDDAGTDAAVDASA